MRRFFKWTFRSLLVFVLLVLLLGGGALFYLNTENGRSFVLDQAKDALAAEGLTLSYRKAEGKLLSRVVLRDVAIRDAQGVFFAAQQLALEWSPSQLISRRLTVDHLELGDARLERQPVLPAQTAPAEPSEGPLSLPVSVRVDRLSLDNLALGAAVAGAPVTLTIDGKASAGRDLRQATLELAYRRVDGDKGRGHLRAVFDAQAEKLDLDLKVNEGRGGFAATLMGLPDLPGLDVELKGAGTLRGWSGRFKVVSDGADLSDGTIRLAAVPNLAVELDARLNPSPLVPRLAVLKDPLRIELAAALRDGTVATIERLSLRTSGLSVSANGRYGIADRTVAAKVAVDAPDLTPLGALLGGDWRGRLEANLDLSGAVAAPRVAGKIAGRDVRTPWGGAGELDTDLTADIGGAAGIRRLVGSVSAKAVSTPQGTVAATTGRFDLRAPATGDYPVGRARLAIQDVRALDYRAERLDVTLVSRAQAGRPLPAVDVTLDAGNLEGPQGSIASLKATGAWSPDAVDDIDFNTDGRLVLDLSGLAGPWATAARLTIDATSTTRPNAAAPAIAATVSGTDLSGQGVEISTLRTVFDGSFTADWRSATGDLRLDATGLVSPWGGAGSMRLALALAGADADGLPLGDLRLAVDGATAPQGAADRLTVRAARDPDGTLDADIRAVGAVTPQASIETVQARVAGLLDRATMRPSILSARVAAAAAETENVAVRSVLLTLTGRKPAGAAPDVFAFKLDLDAADAVGHVPDAPSQEIGPVTASAEGTTDLSAMTLDLTGFSARAGFARVSGRLNASLAAAPRVSGTLKLSGTPPSALLGGVSIREPSLDLTLDANLAGPDVRVDASGSVARVVTGGAQVDELLAGKTAFAVTGRYRPGSITLSRFSIETPAGRATGGGQLDEEGSGNLSIRARVPDLALFKALVGRDVAGGATVNADLSGSFTRLAGRVRVTGEGLSLDGQTVGRLDIRLDGNDLTGLPSGQLRITGDGGPAPIDVSARVENRSDGSWHVDDLRARAFGATASGSATLTGAFAPRDGRVKLSIPDLAPIGRLVGLDLRGRLDADARVAGRDGQLSGDVKATARGLVLPGLRVASLSVDGKVDDAATLKGLRLEASASNVATSAATVSRLRATARPNGKATAITLSAAGTQGGKPVTIDTAATVVDAGATTIATINRLTARYARLPVSIDRPARITLSEGAVKIDETTIALGRGRVTLAGRLAGQTLDAKATIATLPLGIASQAGVDLPVRGTLAGTLALSGSTAAPAIGYDLRLRDLRPAGAGRTGRWIGVDAKGRFQGQRLELDARIANLGDGPVTVSARVPAGAGGQAPPGTPVEGRLAGTLDLGRLSRLGLLGDHTASGKMRVDMRLTGTYGAPVLTGNAALAGGRFENVNTGTVLDDINLRLISAGNALRVNGTMTDGANGRVRLDGRVLLSAARAFPLDVKLVADRAHLMRRDGMDATVSTDLRLNGDLEAGLRVAGTVTVDQADIRIPERLPPNVVLIDVVEKNVPPGLPRPKEPEPASTPLPVALDVTINVPRRFFVRGRGIESEWQGQLKIAGRLPDPQVVGALRTVRGQLDFLGQRFSLADSQIRFGGANLADPLLEIDATTTAGDVKGIVQIRGTAQNPTFTLTSDPELPRDEVLARVLFGSDVGSLTQGQAIRLAAAAAQLAAPGSGGGITDRLRRFAGLDVLDVGSTGENMSDTTVTAGKYIADNVLLKVEQGASAKTSRVGVEIEVFKNVIVESDVGRGGDSRIGVKFRYDY